MVNKNKVKGNKFETEIVHLFNEKISESKWKRIASSGAIGTVLEEPLLCGDIIGKLDPVNMTVRAECKTGYSRNTEGEAKQFTLKKVWLDKIGDEARNTNSLPILVGKFDNTYTGVKKFVVMDVDSFIKLINKLIGYKLELDEFYG